MSHPIPFHLSLLFTLRAFHFRSRGWTDAWTDKSLRCVSSITDKTLHAISSRLNDGFQRRRLMWPDGLHRSPTSITGPVDTLVQSCVATVSGHWRHRLTSREPACQRPISPPQPSTHHYTSQHCAQDFAACKISYDSQSVEDVICHSARVYCCII